MDILRPPSLYNKSDEFEFSFPPEGKVYFQFLSEMWLVGLVLVINI